MNITEGKVSKGGVNDPPTTLPPPPPKGQGGKARTSTTGEVQGVVDCCEDVRLCCKLRREHR